MNHKLIKKPELIKDTNCLMINNLSVLNNLGTAYKELGDTKKAISFYEKVIRINPNHTNAQFNLGAAFYGFAIAPLVRVFSIFFDASDGRSQVRHVLQCAYHEREGRKEGRRG